MNLNIFDQNNYKEIIWGNNKESQYSKSFLESIIQNNPKKLIDNVDCELKILQVEEQFFPITIVEKNSKIKNSYVCSPTGHYIDYTIEELDIELYDNYILKSIFYPILKIFDNLFSKFSFEKVIFINNWLVSTNLYLTFDISILENITTYLKKLYPDHVLVFRSVNELLNQLIYKKLKNLNYHQVINRQVYILDPKKNEYKSKDSFKKDKKLYKNSSYRWYDSNSISIAEIDRVRELYDSLYLSKYSLCNPHFNNKFIKESLENNYLKYFILKKDNRIDAVVGYFERESVMTTPIVGYDMNVPESEGLFRLISLKLMEEAIKNDYILHMSSGVSKFKMHRGGEPFIEYNMIYFDHLDFKRSLPWRLLEKVSDNIVIPYMKKNKL